MYSKTMQIIVSDLGSCLNQNISISDVNEKVIYSSNSDLVGKHAIVKQSKTFVKQFKFNNEDLIFYVDEQNETAVVTFNLLLMMIKRLQSQHKKYEQKTKDQFRLNLLAQELLLGKVSKDYMNDQLNYFSFDTYDVFKLVLMEKKAYKKISLAHMTFPKDDLIYVLILDNSEKVIDAYLAELSNEITGPAIYSLYFYNILEASIKFNFLETIDYKTLDNKLYPLTEFRLNIFLSMIKDSHKEVNHLFEPYDVIKPKDELVKTINAYVESKGSYKATCALLDIHKNTLNYRFKKIEKVLNIDLKNPIEFLELLIALHL